MTALTVLLRQNPIAARVVPFVVVVVLTFAQGWVPSPGQYWLYLFKGIVGAWLLWMAKPALSELRWNFSGEAVVAGILCFVIWVGLDPLLIKLGWASSYPKLSFGSSTWNPTNAFGVGSLGAIFFMAVRFAVSGILIPMLEEVFYRSFVYRYVERVDFLSIPLAAWLPRSLLITSVLFASEHREWLAAIFVAVIFQALVWRKNRLGDAIAAHAITNVLLGAWVLWKGAWEFW